MLQHSLNWPQHTARRPDHWIEPHNRGDKTLQKNQRNHEITNSGDGRGEETIMKRVLKDSQTQRESFLSADQKSNFRAGGSESATSAHDTDQLLLQTSQHTPSFCLDESSHSEEDRRGIEKAAAQNCPPISEEGTPFLTRETREGQHARNSTRESDAHSSATIDLCFEQHRDEPQ